MGQLLVVLPVKQKLALPELIPDPIFKDAWRRF